MTLVRAADSCKPSDLHACYHSIVGSVGDAAGSVLSDMAGSAWDSICASFAKACTDLLGEFAKAFRDFPGPRLGSVTSVYSVTLTLGMTVALVLLLIQAGAVLWTRSGAALAQAVTGLVKAALASLLTLVVASQTLKASDEVTAWIITANGSSTAKFADGFATLVKFSKGIASPLILLFALLGIVLTLVLWFELLLRNAAILILVGTAPIAAAGQIAGGTQDWWRKLVKTGVQLALLKPVIALVFLIGFATTTDAEGIAGLLSGLLVLFLAVFAWPVIARFFTFTSTAAGGAMGAGAAVGALAASGHGGVEPGAFQEFSERRAMSASAARSGGSISAGAGGTGKAGAALGPVAAAAITAAASLQKTINAVTSRMEQTAGHGGVEGASPTAHPAGFPAPSLRRAPTRPPTAGSDGDTRKEKGT